MCLESLTTFARAELNHWQCQVALVREAQQFSLLNALAYGAVGVEVEALVVGQTIKPEGEVERGDLGRAVSIDPPVNGRIGEHFPYVFSREIMNN